MEETNERPPVFKTWNGWYIMVITVLVAQIILFIYFTKYFS